MKVKYHILNLFEVKALQLGFGTSSLQITDKKDE